MTRDLTICLHCGGDYVYPVEWHEIDPENWHVLTRCGGCGSWKVGNYDNETMDAFENRLEDALDLIEKAIMAGELVDFVEALAVDAILPEDF
jgi:hypothetical protein